MTHNQFEQIPTRQNPSKSRHLPTIPGLRFLFGLILENKAKRLLIDSGVSFLPWQSRWRLWDKGGWQGSPEGYDARAAHFPCRPFEHTDRPPLSLAVVVSTPCCPHQRVCQ
jgi:hypothetical protein